jgi:8-oxo-dGTP diphosphatase
MCDSYERSLGMFPRLGSAVMVTDDQRVLLGQRAKDPNRGKWILPGGKVEPFESLEEAGRREVLEETGLEIEITGRIGIFEIIDPGTEHRVIVYHYARPIGGKLRASSDLSQAEWVLDLDLPSRDLTSIVKQVLQQAGWI